MITSKELAKLAGVSQSTVSRCLNDSPLVAEETKIKVKKLAEEHSFVLNSSARELRTSKTNIIGYVFSEKFTGFSRNFAQSHLYHTIRGRLVANWLDLIPIFDDLEDGNNIEKCIQNRRVDGLIINRTHLEPHIMQLIEKRNLPHIFIHDPSADSEYQYVISSNHKRNGYLAGNAFCEKGYDRFAEVLGAKGCVDAAEKHSGFAQALREHGKEISAANMFYGNYTFESAFEITMQNIERFRQINACFVHNDVMALAVMEALRQSGIRVPEDIVLIGHDDIPMASWFKPHLSTIAVDYDRISAIAADWMIELTGNNRLTESRKVVINGELVIRDTFF